MVFGGTNQEIKRRDKIENKIETCRFCKGTNIKLETWSSGGYMCMVKCNNPDCPIPPEGYPTGRDPEKVMEEWNRRQCQ